MPAIPAFCDTCGTAFNFGIFAENSTINFSGNKAGPCPRCGGIGHVPDGFFNFIGRTIEILSAPERTIRELQGLEKIFTEARSKGENNEQVVARVEKELPSLSSLANLLPANKAELYAFLGVVIATIALFTQSPNTPPSQTIVNINQVVQQITIAQPLANSRQPQSQWEKKQGRNEQCICGSGEKYKKCCGAIK